MPIHEKLYIAAAGIISSTGADLIIPTKIDYSEIVKVTVQLIIGVVTLIGLFKKPKSKR